MALTMILSYPHNDFEHPYHWLVCYHKTFCLCLVSLYGLHKDSLWHIIQLSCSQNDIFQTHNVFCALMIISLCSHSDSVWPYRKSVWPTHWIFDPQNNILTPIIIVGHSLWLSNLHIILCDVHNDILWHSDYFCPQNDYVWPHMRMYALSVSRYDLFNSSWCSQLLMCFNNDSLWHSEWIYLSSQWLWVITMFWVSYQWDCVTLHWLCVPCTISLCNYHNDSMWYPTMALCAPQNVFLWSLQKCLI